MSESSSNLINEYEINTKNDQYIEFYKNTCNELIENDLSNLAYDFLDIQAKKEKETKKNILNENRRTHKDFIETTKNFLEKNFNYNGQLLYIIYLINQKYFIQNLKDNLNGLTEKLLEQNDIKKLISDCFIKKFEQFENKIKENKDKLDSIFKNNVNILDNDSKDDNNINKENDNDIPPANNIKDYPVKEQIEKTKKEDSEHKIKITANLNYHNEEDDSNKFLKKIKQFENKDKLHSMLKKYKNILDNDSKDDDNNNNNNKENDNDLPPANNIKDYPVKEQIEKTKKEDSRPKIKITAKLKKSNEEDDLSEFLKY